MNKMKKIIIIIISLLMIILSIMSLIDFKKISSLIFDNERVYVYFLVFNIIFSVLLFILSFLKVNVNKLLVPGLVLIISIYLLSVVIINNVRTYYYQIQLPEEINLIFYILVLGFLANNLLFSKYNTKVSGIINIFVYVYLILKLIITYINTSEYFHEFPETIAMSYTLMISSLLLGLVYVIIYQTEIINDKKEALVEVLDNENNNN